MFDPSNSKSDMWCRIGSTSFLPVITPCNHELNWFRFHPCFSQGAATQQRHRSQCGLSRMPSCSAKVSISSSSALPSLFLIAYLTIINPESNRERPVRDWWPRWPATPVLPQGSQLPNRGQIWLPWSRACWCQRQTRVLPSGRGVQGRATLWP